MYISKLIHTIETYDPYGIHRVNGIKVVYVLLILFAVNGLFYIPNPYFYFFYVPITAMTAEVQGATIADKFKLFIGVTAGTIIMVVIFNSLYTYPLFFIFFSYLATFSLYWLVLHKHPTKLLIVPIILSLVSYSLNYRTINGDDYAIINHAITTLVAMTIVIAALLLFPRSFYYRIWLRAFGHMVTLCRNNFLALQLPGGKVAHMPMHTIHLVNFSHMVPPHMAVYSIHKITILIHELYLQSCMVEDKTPSIQQQKIIDNLRLLFDAIDNERPCRLTFDNEDGIVSKIITSWNYVCKKS